MYLLEYNLSETEESVHDADSFSIIQTIHRFMRAKLSRDAEGRSYDFTTPKWVIILTNLIDLHKLR